MSRSSRIRAFATVFGVLATGVFLQSGALALADQPVGSQSIQLASGTTATTYAVQGGPSGTASTVQTPLTSPCTRYSDISGAAWITATDTTQPCGSNAGVNATTVYTATFTLPDRSTNTSLSLSYFSDNYAGVTLDGTNISTQPTGDVPANYQGSPTTATAAGFGAGQHTLAFTVTDAGAVTGLDYAATVNYDVLPDKVANLLVTPGNGSAVVSWSPPTDTGSAPLSSTAPYVITVSGSGSGTGTTQVPPSAVQPCLGNTASVCYNVSGLTNGTTYTFAVAAQTSVGTGATVSQDGKPSADSAATIVAPNVTQTVSTCKYATKLQPVCDNYTVPAGGGGVFGLTGNVPVSGNFCGGPCSGNGAQSILPPVGYTDPKHPIVDTVTWDASISPRGIFTKVYYQTDTGQPFQLKFCKNPFVANPDPCISTLLVLWNPFNPVVNGDVQVRILTTSSADPLKAHH